MLSPGHTDLVRGFIMKTLRGGLVEIREIHSLSRLLLVLDSEDELFKEDQKRRQASAEDTEEA